MRRRAADALARSGSSAWAMLAPVLEFEEKMPENRLASSADLSELKPSLLQTLAMLWRRREAGNFGGLVFFSLALRCG